MKQLSMNTNLDTLTITELIQRLELAQSKLPEGQLTNVLLIYFPLGSEDNKLKLITVSDKKS
jgi:hypothetical protein